MATRVLSIDGDLDDVDTPLTMTVLANTRRDPTMDWLRAWYDSPEYAPARVLAPTALRRRLLFAEGTGS